MLSRSTYNRHPRSCKTISAAEKHILRPAKRTAVRVHLNERMKDILCNVQLEPPT